MAGPLPAVELKKLASVDSPTIANIIELFGVQSRIAGYVNGSIRAVYPDLPPTVGYAVTATFRSAYPTTGQGDVYDTLSAIIEGGEKTEGPAFMVVEDLDDPPVSATYGEVMATAMIAAGYVGLATSGGGRDYEQVKALKLPCFANSMIVAHGFCHFESSGTTVTLGGLTVNPGDLLHGDANGIVKIPEHLAPHVSRFIEPFMAAEEIMMSYLRKGNVNFKDAAKVQHEMRDAQEALAKEAAALIAGNG